MKIAPDEFKYPYYYQSIYSEPDAMPSACRLRRSDTTGFTKWEFENTGNNYNKGIFIDIFPLFYVPESIQERAEQKRAVVKLWEYIRGYGAWKMREEGCPVPSAYEEYIPNYLSYCQKIGGVPDITKLKEDYLLACASASERTTELGATSSKCHQSNLMWNTEWFDQVVYLQFEDTSIPCPYEYEKVLEKQYGDWRVPVRGGAKHEMVIADADLPWRQYSPLSQWDKTKF